MYYNPVSRVAGVLCIRVNRALVVILFCWFERIDNYYTLLDFKKTFKSALNLLFRCSRDSL